MKMLFLIYTLVMTSTEVMKCLNCCWLNHIRPPLEEVKAQFNHKTVMFLFQSNKKHHYKNIKMKFIVLR